MNFRSFCSGIGAPEQAWKPLGWRCLSTSEIDPQASAVLAHHNPEAQNLGDLTTCLERMDDQYADVFVAGTPCQSFSVAGLRAGMDDPRGNLALVFLGLVDRRRPEWVVWENVPGVLSSGGGRDFGSFLGGLAELGYGFAYRVLDAQYVRVESHPRAVPQRRRRVFVVARLGDWRGPASVLLERESLCGHPPPGREAGEGTAGTLESRSCGGGFPGTDGACAGHVVATLDAQYGRLQGQSGQDANHGHSHLVFDPVNITSKANRTRVEPGLPCPTMHASSMAVAFNWQTGGSKARLSARDSHTDALGANQVPAVAFDTFNHTVSDTNITLQRGGTLDHIGATLSHGGVRRLTPRECDRLQGFPDDYTLVQYKGKPMADGPRYRMLGNSMAVNVMSWIGQRLGMFAGLGGAA